MEKKKLYLCDPTINHHCAKLTCYMLHPHQPMACRRTSDPACAILDADGSPIEAPVGRGMMDLRTATFRFPQPDEREQLPGQIGIDEALTEVIP